MGAAEEGGPPVRAGGEHRVDAAVRVVSDPATGRTWRVWAAATAHVPGALAGDCLLFDAGEVVRRVWGVPPGWPALSDAALLALAAAPPGRPRGHDDPNRTRADRAD